MPRGLIDINGVVIDLSKVKAFSKIQKSARYKRSYIHESNFDYGIKFVFHGGSTKIIWWFAESSYDTNMNSPHKRDEIYRRLSQDFNVVKY
jgi:hypothetical protein